MKSVEESYQRRELKTFQIHESEEMKVAANRIDLNQFPHLSLSFSFSLSDLLSSSPPSPLLSSPLSSLHPPSAASDHWWISCVTSRARCSRERGTTPQC